MQRWHVSSGPVPVLDMVRIISELLSVSSSSYSAALAVPFRVLECRHVPVAPPDSTRVAIPASVSPGFRLHLILYVCQRARLASLRLLGLRPAPTVRRTRSSSAPTASVSCCAHCFASFLL